VTPGYRRESSYIGGQRWCPGLVELAHGFLHVDSVPVDDGVEGETEDPKLLLLETVISVSASSDRLRARATINLELCQDSPSSIPRRESPRRVPMRSRSIWSRWKCRASWRPTVRRRSEQSPDAGRQ
jgi:hypothetical protein